MSNRQLEFELFAEIVLEHIEKYAVAQYGDVPDDPVQSWTPAQCMDSVKRYADRIETGRRGRLETIRDMVKIAHFACLAFGKLNPTEEEIVKIIKGEV